MQYTEIPREIEELSKLAQNYGSVSSIPNYILFEHGFEIDSRKGIINIQPRIYLPDLEAGIHRLMNGERSNDGLSELEYDQRLADISRSYSKRMGREGFFAHEDPQGKSVKDRAVANGYKFKYLGENLAQIPLTHKGRGYFIGNEEVIIYKWRSQERLAKIVTNDLMKSPGHRANILRREFSKEGIGAFIGNDDFVYVTQMFS